MAQWQKVFEDKTLHRAEIVKDILIDNDINAIVFSKKDSAYHFGQYEVQVPPEYVIQAIKIITEDINFG
jgi:hypothetical protein